MTKIVWNASGERGFETGIEKTVVYTNNFSPVPWYGVASITNTPTGGEVAGSYYDGKKYLNSFSKQEFKATIKAYSIPFELENSLGKKMLGNVGLSVTQQESSFFNISYQTKVGNDTQGLYKGYKIHLIFNAISNSSDNNYQTIGSNITTNPFSIVINAVPPVINGVVFSSYMIIDSTKHSEPQMNLITDILYGTSTTLPRFITHYELAMILGG